MNSAKETSTIHMKERKREGGREGIREDFFAGERIGRESESKV